MKRFIVLVALAVTASSCGGLRKKLDQSKLDRQMKKAPESVRVAKKNKDAGQADYDKRLDAAPRRGQGDPVIVVYSLNLTDVREAFKKDVPEKKHKYMDSAFAKSWGLTLSMLTTNFEASFGDVELHAIELKTRGATYGYCKPQDDWFAAMAECAKDGDVYLWIHLHPIEVLPECDNKRGFRVQAKWSSAYRRKDHAAEVTFCAKENRKGFAELMSEVVSGVHETVGPDLPAVSEALALTPPHRYDSFVVYSSYQGGGSSFDFD